MTDQPGRRVYLDFVGCRLNQAEIDLLSRGFSAQGDRIVAAAAEADLIVLNTCAVTREAERKSRKLIYQAGRDNPQAEVAITGCYAALAPGRVGRLPGVRHVIPSEQKDNLVQIVTPGGDIPLYEREPLLRAPLPPGTLGRTRAFIKVQDGCDNRCTFCITTVARGAGRSRPQQQVLDEIEALAQAGYQEAVLTGVQLGSYGHDLGDRHGLAHLIEAVLRHTSVPRLRLSSLEPWDAYPELFDLWQDQRLLPHLHLPLQAGCDATLRRMARRTTQHSFTELAAAAFERIPDLALTTDIICGFPGETDAEFEQTRRFIQQIGFARLHVFSYSAREGTAAAQMPGQVPEALKRERRAALQQLSDDLWEGFRRRFIGLELPVLWESARGVGPDGFMWQGLTGSYIRVECAHPAQLANCVTACRITGLAGDGLLGQPIISTQGEHQYG